MSEIIRIQDGTPLLDTAESKKIAEFENAMKQMKAQEKALKAAILAEMLDKSIIRLQNDDISITFVSATTCEYFDSKAFRAAYPDLYDEFVTIKPIRESIRIRVNG